MSIKADRTAIIAELGKDKKLGKIGRGVKALFGDAKTQVTVTFAGENAEKTENRSYYTRELKTRYAVIVQSRSDTPDDDDALELIDKIKQLLHAKRLQLDGVDEEVLNYTGTQFNEMIEGSGVWVHTLIFEKVTELRANSQNVL